MSTLDFSMTVLLYPGRVSESRRITKLLQQSIAHSSSLPSSSGTVTRGNDHTGPTKPFLLLQVTLSQGKDWEVG